MDGNKALYRPNSVLGRLEKAGYVKPYDSVVGFKCKQVNLLFKQSNLGYRQHFGFDPELDNSTIKGISVLNTTESANNGQYTAASGDYRANLSSATMAELLFVLAHDDRELVRLPLNTMVRTDNSGKFQLFDVSDQIWADSYVEILATGSISTNDTISLMVYYE
jgi:hypothetical protein